MSETLCDSKFKNEFLETRQASQPPQAQIEYEL